MSNANHLFLNLRVRFLPANNQILKTVVGFCNQFGVRIVVGVDDTQRGCQSAAVRRLSELVKQGFLIRTGAGVSTRYRRNLVPD
ncbi:MAG: hypothetical protein JW915_03490 [Chitinispirillaceae bacterium]|nr:hypothetical protein [Chitinispirillaceae bacterium]